MIFVSVIGNRLSMLSQNLLVEQMISDNESNRVYPKPLEIK